MKACELAFEQDNPGFVAAFPKGAEIDRLYRETYIDVHRRYVEAQAGFDELMK
jgi:hypothetical protein